MSTGHTFPADAEWPDTALAEVGGPRIENAPNGTCVPEGSLFTDYYSCPSVVGPMGSVDVDSASQVVQPDPARLDDPDLEWSRDQLKACSCICCHGQPGAPPHGPTGEGRYVWDWEFGPTWTDSASSSVLRRMATAPPVLGAPAATNHGFDRNVLSVPTTDPERMAAFLERELARR